VATPELAAERAEALKDQMVFDVHTHFIRDDAIPAPADRNLSGRLMWQRVLTTKPRSAVRNEPATRHSKSSHRR
jgi:hypothetical protein